MMTLAYITLQETVVILCVLCNCKSVSGKCGWSKSSVLIIIHIVLVRVNKTFKILVHRKKPDVIFEFTAVFPPSLCNKADKLHTSNAQAFVFLVHFRYISVRKQRLMELLGAIHNLRVSSAWQGKSKGKMTHLCTSFAGKVSVVFDLQQFWIGLMI